MDRQPVVAGEPTPPVEFKAPLVCMALSAVAPGAGHLYLGVVDKAIMFVLGVGVGIALLQLPVNVFSLPVPWLLLIAWWGYAMIDAYREGWRQKDAPLRG